MSSSVFRNSSIERVSSPEQLNDYIKVSNPSVWIVLIATIIFLVGVVVWGIFGRLTTTQETVAIAHDDKVICYVPAQNINNISTGMEVEIGDSTGKVYAIADSPIEIGQDFDSYAMYLGGYQTGEWVYAVKVQIMLTEGVYPAQIVTEKLSPMSFILN